MSEIYFENGKYMFADMAEALALADAIYKALGRETWEPVEDGTNLKGYKDGFQVAVKPEMLMVESFWYWGEIPLPDDIRLCRKRPEPTP